MLGSSAYLTPQMAACCQQSFTVSWARVEAGSLQMDFLQSKII
jgi:hypothetical protein